MVATFTVEIISNRSVRLSTGPRLKNRFGLDHFTAEHIFSLSTNNLTYKGSRYENSPPVKLKNSKPLQKSHLVNDSGRLFAERLLEDHLALPRLLERDVAEPLVHPELRDLGEGNGSIVVKHLS